MDSLTARQLEILAFERQWWKRDGATVRELFGCTQKQYVAELAALIALPAAVAYDPLLVKRLRRAAAVPSGGAASPRATIRSH